METVDKSGINQNINQTVYKSMKEKLDKFEQVLTNISQEIKDNYAHINKTHEEIEIVPEKF